MIFHENRLLAVEIGALRVKVATKRENVVNGCNCIVVLLMLMYKYMYFK